jgi:hypothetical protein
MVNERGTSDGLRLTEQQIQELGTAAGRLAAQVAALDRRLATVEQLLGMHIDSPARSVVRRRLGDV